MKSLYCIPLFLALALTAAAQPISCTYDNGPTALQAHCTLPDGSGVDTWISGTSTTVTDYSPQEWTVRLKTLADADLKYSATVDAATAPGRAIAAENSAALAIHEKKTCKNAGFKWDFGVCTPK